MHQHPRSPARTPSSFPARPSSARAEDQSRQDSGLNAQSSDTRTNTAEDAAAAADSGIESMDHAHRPTKEAIAKLNQIISVCSLVWSSL